MTSVGVQSTSSSSSLSPDFGNTETEDESTDEEERFWESIWLFSLVQNKFVLLPRFGVAIISSLVIGALICGVGFCMIFVEDRGDRFAAILLWQIEGLIFFGFSSFGLYAMEKYSVITLLGGHKKIPIHLLRMFVASTCATFVFGVYVLVGSSMHQKGDQVDLFAEPRWFSIVKGLLLMTYSALFQGFSWFLWFSQMEMPSDGTILPLVYVRCLCLPAWLKQFLCTLVPLLILTILSVFFVVRIWRSSHNMSEYCETHVHLYIVSCACLFLIYVFIAVVSLYIAKISIHNRMISKLLIVAIIFSSILWGVLGESLTVSAQCRIDANKTGDGHVAFHLVNLLRVLFLSFGFGILFISIWCKCESLLETYPVFDSEDFAT